MKKAVIAAAGRFSRQLHEQGVLTPLIKSVLSKIVVASERVEIEVNRAAFMRLLELPGAAEAEEAGQPLKITVPVRIKKSGRPSRILISPFDLNERQPSINAGMLKAIGRAHKWDKELRAGKSMSDIAKAENVHRSYVGQVIPLAFLAPDIVEAILDGRQPPELKVEQLLRSLPVEWAAQRQVLGFPNP